MSVRWPTPARERLFQATILDCYPGNNRPSGSRHEQYADDRPFVVQVKVVLGASCLLSIIFAAHVRLIRSAIMRDEIGVTIPSHHLLAIDFGALV